MRTPNLYRLAHLAAGGEFSQVGRAHLTLDSARVDAVLQNEERKGYGLPLLTHVAIYTQTNIQELPRPRSFKP